MGFLSFHVLQPRRGALSTAHVPSGTLEWGGQFENMERANRKLMFVVPMALALIFVLLFFSLKTLPPGVYEYRIVADGEWMPDPLTPETTPNAFGGMNSVLRIEAAD